MMNYNAMLSGLRDLVDNPTPPRTCAPVFGYQWLHDGCAIHELNLVFSSTWQR